MKAFRFSLESVLVLRKQLQEQAFQKWAQAVQELKRARDEGQRIQREIDAWNVVRREQQVGAVMAEELIRSQRAALVFHRIWNEHQRLEQILDQRVQQALHLWHEARRKQEILERLKKRSRMRWLQENDREEQKINDERAMVLAYRKKMRQGALQPA